MQELCFVSDCVCLFNACASSPSATYVALPLATTACPLCLTLVLAYPHCLGVSSSSSSSSSSFYCTRDAASAKLQLFMQVLIYPRTKLLTAAFFSAWFSGKGFSTIPCGVCSVHCSVLVSTGCDVRWMRKGQYWRNWSPRVLPLQAVVSGGSVHCGLAVLVTTSLLGVTTTRAYVTQSLYMSCPPPVHQLTNTDFLLTLTVFVTAGNMEEEQDRYISQVKEFQEKVSHFPCISLLFTAVCWCGTHHCPPPHCAGVAHTTVPPTVLVWHTHNCPPPTVLVWHTHNCPPPHCAGVVHTPLPPPPPTVLVWYTHHCPPPPHCAGVVYTPLPPPPTVLVWYTHHCPPLNCAGVVHTPLPPPPPIVLVWEVHASCVLCAVNEGQRRDGQVERELLTNGSSGRVSSVGAVSEGDGGQHVLATMMLLSACLHTVTSQSDTPPLATTLHSLTLHSLTLHPSLPHSTH